MKKIEFTLEQYADDINNYTQPLNLPKVKIAETVGILPQHLDRDIDNDLKQIKKIEEIFQKLHSIYDQSFYFKIVLGDLAKKESGVVKTTEGRIIKNLKTIEIKDEPLEVITQPASAYFLKVLNEFRRHNKYDKRMKDHDLKIFGNTKKAFLEITEWLEDLRVKTLGINRDKFYRLVAEFQRQQNNRKYYVLNQIFSTNMMSSVVDEFTGRIWFVMMNIAQLIPKSKDIADNVEKFKKKISLDKIPINLANIPFKKKDWYCLAAILQYAKDKNWSDDLLSSKIKSFYDWRHQYIPLEIILKDVASGELDLMESGKKKKSFAQQQEDIIRKTKGQWHEEFKKNEKEQQEKGRVSAKERRTRIDEYRKKYGLQLKWGHLPEELGMTIEQFKANEEAGLYDKGQV